VFAARQWRARKRSADSLFRRLRALGIAFDDDAVQFDRGAIDSSRLDAPRCLQL
jgi:hypothetical protein